MSAQEGAMLALQACRDAIHGARESARLASAGLAGSRKTRAEDLAERLTFVCLADAASAAHEARVAGVES
jgi:hypothetical protein